MCFGFVSGVSICWMYQLTVLSTYRLMQLYAVDQQIISEQFYDSGFLVVFVFECQE
jgi:hypothetical protein